jgi:hypothetical protein
MLLPFGHNTAQKFSNKLFTSKYLNKSNLPFSRNNLNVDFIFPPANFSEHAQQSREANFHFSFNV